MWRSLLVPGDLAEGCRRMIFQGVPNQNLAEADVQLGPRTFQKYHSLRTYINAQVFPAVACL